MRGGFGVRSLCFSSVTSFLSPLLMRLCSPTHPLSIITTIKINIVILILFSSFWQILFFILWPC
jgi:hypothetical protein